jgi:hypothetical protein
VVSVKRSVGIQKEPRRWPWVIAVLAVVAAGVAVLVRRKAPEDQWTPAPTGDGPVPSYREDPVPSSPSTPAGGTETPEAQGKTVSTAMTTPSDSSPTDTNIGALAQQPAAGPEDQSNLAAPEPASSTYNDPDTPVASAAPESRTEAPGSAGNPAATRGTRPDEDSAG